MLMRKKSSKDHVVRMSSRNHSRAQYSVIRRALFCTINRQLLYVVSLLCLLIQSCGFHFSFGLLVLLLFHSCYAFDTHLPDVSTHTQTRRMYSPDWQLIPIPIPYMLRRLFFITFIPCLSLLICPCIPVTDFMFPFLLQAQILLMN